MCGRYVQTSPADALATRFGARLPEGIAWTPRWNVAPVHARARSSGTGPDGPVLALALVGSPPSWARDDGGPRPINARAEGIAGKPMFRDALKRRRALVPADGFYEWKAGKSAKTPWFFRLAGGAPFALAGLWERRESPGGEAVESFAIVTTEANALVEARPRADARDPRRAGRGALAAERTAHGGGARAVPRAVRRRRDGGLAGFHRG